MVHFLRSMKFDQYIRIGTAYRGLAHFFRFNDDSMRYHPPAEVEVKHLEVIKGIGIKTARFFAMHTRSHQQYACLDTHILRWLGMRGHDIPKTTPQGDKYLTLEKIFLDCCRDLGKVPADIDLEIWNEVHKKIEMPS